MVAAKEGHTIMEFDYKSFHVITLGFEARDPGMIRIGRIDMHSFFTAKLLHLNTPDRMLALTDGELTEYLGWVKKNHKHYRDAKAKHAILGYNNGMGYNKLYNQYTESFSSKSEAKMVMTELDNLFPLTKQYRTDICQKAHEQGYLISRHGYIRYFWEVFRYAGPGKWSHGDDHEAALCFYTQNDAHGELKDRILAIADRGLDEKYGLLNTIHDSLIFECPNALVEECHHEVKSIMEAPSTVLIDPVVAPQGLSVEVDVQAGPTWAAMKGL
jgi:DNA polymerase family A